MRRKARLRSTTGLDRGPGPERKTGLRPVSRRRQAKNRVRSRVAHETFGDHPVCAVPWCGRWADDAHELLTRARGGSITDPANITPLCRDHHNWAHDNPNEAGRVGLLRHSWE